MFRSIPLLCQGNNIHDASTGLAIAPPGQEGRWLPDASPDPDLFSIFVVVEAVCPIPTVNCSSCIGDFEPGLEPGELPGSVRERAESSARCKIECAAAE